MSVKLCSVLGIKEGIRAAAMRRGGLVLFDPHIYNRSLGPADRKGIRPARPAGRNRRVEKITIGTALALTDEIAACIVLYLLIGIICYFNQMTSIYSTDFKLN